jgi:predicted Zn-dependent protease with MMP-like domain
MPVRVTLQRFEEIALAAIRGLPAEFRQHAEECAISIEPRPSPEVLEKLDIPEGEQLFGYYEGVALVDRHLDDLPGPPPRIILYHRPLMAACDSEEELEREIRTTVLHEIGHHLGIDEDRLEELGYG